MKTRGQVSGFTGRHMLLSMLAFFGVIITVNLTMAYFAKSSWTGLVVKNSYVASQEFNGKMAETRAQAALGWTSELGVSDGRIRYALSDRNGNAIGLGSVSLMLMHPLGDKFDHRIELERGADGIFELAHTLDDGPWLVDVEADAGLDKPYREKLRIQIEQGQLK